MGIKTLAIILTIGVLAAMPVQADGKTCHCRTSTGEKIIVGGFTCLKTQTGLKEAKCGFVLNNTAWKLTGNLCPSAFAPLVQPVAVQSH